jgi:hypothetical protein
MSDAAGKAPPTSPNKTTDGNKCNCPYAQQKTCHVKQLKVKITPKKHEPPSAPKDKRFAFMPKPEPGEDKPQELIADLQVNRIKLPISRLLKIEAKGEDAASDLHFWQFQEKNKRKQAAIEAGQKAAKQLAFVRSTLGRWYDKEVLALLQDYDLVLETVASFPMDETALYTQNTARSLNAVDIEVEGESEGKCPTQSHLVLSCKATSNAGNQCIDATPWPKGYPIKPRFAIAAPVSKTGYDLEQAAWAIGQNKFTLKEVHAAAIVADAQTPQNALAAVMKFLRLGFSFIHPMDLSIRMSTCGRKDQRMVYPAELVALVRVYRDVQYGVGLRIPAFAKVTHEEIPHTYDGKAHDYQLKEKESTTKTRALDWEDGFGKQKKTETEGHNAPKDSTEERSRFHVYLKMNDYELDLMELYEQSIKEPGFKDVEYGKLLKGGRSASSYGDLLKNKQGWILALAKLAGGTQKAWKGFYEAINGFLWAMKQAPQLGYKLSCEVSFLEGDLEAGLSMVPGKPNLAMPPEISKRYLPTKWKFKIGISIIIVAAKIEASFGLLLQIPAMGKLEARVVGQITGSVELKGFEAEFVKGEETEKKSGITGRVCGRLFAVAALETWFLTMKEEIGIEAGLQIDFELKWKHDGTEHELKIYTLPVQWYWVKVNSRTKTAASKAYVLYESRLLLSEKSAEKHKTA